MISSKWWQYGLGLLIMLYCAIASATVNVVHVRIDQEGGVSRWVFNLSAPVHYQLDDKDARRLVLTLAHTKLRFPLPKLPDATPVTAYQMQQQGQALQLIFTLNTPVAAKAYMATSSAAEGNRLMLELSAAAAPTAAAPATTVAKATPVVHEQHTQPKPIVAAKPTTRKKVVVVIDPGHGGKDPGAVGPSGHQEKDVVLAIAKVLQRSLQQYGYQAILTRDRDIFIPLRQRLAIARRYKPDLFIAVHADASFNNDGANGASVFALSERGATSEMAHWLAVKENQSELVDGIFVDKDPMLRSVLLDLSQTHTIGVSLAMGRTLLQQLSTVTHLHYMRVEQAAFVVLKSPDIPSLLIETGYITNPHQEQQLCDPSYQQQLAAVIAQGIRGYFAQHAAV